MLVVASWLVWVLGSRENALLVVVHSRRYVALGSLEVHVDDKESFAVPLHAPADPHLVDSFEHHNGVRVSLGLLGWTFAGRSAASEVFDTLTAANVVAHG